MKTFVGLLVVAGLILGLLWMQGIFDKGKVGPASQVREPEAAGDVEGVLVTEEFVPVYSEAVGTVRSRRTTRVTPQIMGTILAINVAEGVEVNADDIVALLDDHEVKARVTAANARLDQVEAVYTRAASDFRRTTELFEKGATTKERLEGSQADYDSAKASVAAARAAVEEAEIFVEYTKIRTRLKGVVAEKLAEPGDLALPGKPILVVQDPSDLRLEADVRESQITHLEIGTPVTVLIGDPGNEPVATKIEKTATEADPRTRTFRVKAPLGKDSGARPGNFGRLRFRTGERQVVLVPREAVRRIGQLETVKVVEDGRIRVRHVRTGRSHGDRLEVLSGLAADERVVVGR